MIWTPLFALQVYFKIHENNERLHYVFYGIVMDYTVYYKYKYCPMMWFFIDQWNLCSYTPPVTDGTHVPYADNCEIQYS